MFLKVFSIIKRRW